MTDSSEKPREWWIGRTESGFDKWLTAKHPEETECRNVFISSDGSEPCVEYIHVIEYSEVTSLREAVKEAIKTLAYYSQIYPEPSGKEVYTRRAIECRAKLKALVGE